VQTHGQGDFRDAGARAGRDHGGIDGQPLAKLPVVVPPGRVGDSGQRGDREHRREPKQSSLDSLFHRTAFCARVERLTAQKYSARQATRTIRKSPALIAQSTLVPQIQGLEHAALRDPMQMSQIRHRLALKPQEMS
jgi:hypothetical protein